MTAVASYMDPELVLFLNANSREEAIHSLIDQLNAKGKLKNKELFSQAIFAREALVSTAIGMGIAIPHAKLAGYEEFFIAIGILSKGVDWKALDHLPVRLIFLIGGPEHKQTEYLKLLSGLTLLIKNDEIRKKMLALNSPIDIIGLFT
ncbi:MAG: PTS sugar transporter subunit IIA [Parachlamydiaceae bacterium]